MKRSIIFFVFSACLSLGFAVGCAGTPQPTEKERAEALKAAVVGHESWAQHPKFKGIQKSSDNTHGAYVQIWYNNIAASVMGKFSGEYPDGAIFIKRGYADKDGTKPRQFVTAMQKIKGYDSPNGEWFTLRIWDKDINPLSGWAPDKKYKDCIQCHESAKNGHDYIRYTLDFNFKF